jgi:hypothetical protein
MKITIFTSNSSRHINLINKILSLGHECFAVIENKKISKTLKKNSLKEKYFKKVIKSEKKIFNNTQLLKKNLSLLNISWGKINFINKKKLKGFLNSDLYIVFGASYIKGWLINHLIQKKAINLHIGLSPYYRGAACNFWAVYDNNPHLVGATIHYLSKAIDSGKILFHVLPSKKYKNDFDFTMGSVLSAQKALISKIRNKTIFNMRSSYHNKKEEIRYSKIKDFNNLIIKDYLKRNKKFLLPNYDKKIYINPYFDK